MSTAGFHTVKFSSARWAPQGSKFAVVVKLTTPGYNWPIACEYAEADYRFRGPGRSRDRATSPRMASSGLIFTEWDPTANVCLKATAPTTPASRPHRRRRPASSATARSGLKFRVSDPLPSCGTATVKIQILKGRKS